MSGIIKPPVGAQLKLDHPLARGLVGCWLANEGSGNKLFDIVHGTEHSFLGFYPPVWDKGNLWFYVENGDSYVDLANAQGVRPLGNAFTIDLLTYLDNVGEANVSLFFWDVSTSWRCGLCRNSTAGWPTRLVGGGTQDYMIPAGWPPVTVGLYHIVLIWDGTNKLFYLNGKLLQSKVATHGAGNIGMSDCNNIRLGRAGDYQASTQIVRYFRLYDRALSAQEIATLYAFPYAMFEEESPYLIWKAAGGEEEEVSGAIAGAGGAAAVAKIQKEFIGSSAGDGAISGTSKILKKMILITVGSLIYNLAAFTGRSKISKEFLGTSSPGGDAAGSAKISRELIGSSAATGGGSGLLRKLAAFIGSFGGTSALSGPIKRLREIIGNFASSGGATAAVKIRKILAGASAAISALAGIIDRTVPSLAAVVNGISDLVSKLKRRRRMPGTSAASTAITGLAYEHRKIVGLSGGVAATSGVMKRRRGVAGAVTAVTTASAWAKIRKALASTWAGVSTVAGLLASTVLATWPVIHNAIARVRIQAAKARDRIKTSTRD